MRPRRARRRLGGIAVALLLAGGMIAGAIGDGGAAFAVSRVGGVGASVRATAATTDPTMTLSPAGGGILEPGAALRLTIEIQNPAATTLPSGSIAIALDAAAPATTATVTDRILHPVIAGYLVGSVKSPQVQPGDTVTVTTTVAEDKVMSVLGTDPGARLMTAELDVGDERRALTASVITWMTSAFTTSASLATVVPFTAPATDTGIVDAASLTALTGSPDDVDPSGLDDQAGAWTGELTALTGTSAIVALDPAIPASVRALGNAAPASATAFLQSLSGLSNEFVELPYADTDLALEHAAGARKVLAAGTFAKPLDDLRNTPAPSPTPTLTPVSQSPAPTSTPTAGSDATLTASSLLAWNYASTTLAWPRTHSAKSSDLAFLAASGYRAVLLSSADVHDTAARAAAGPRAEIGSTTALVADATVSTLLDAAVSGDTAASHAALAELIAVLATDASSGAARSVLATVDRGAVDSRALARVFRVLDAQAWIHRSTLATLLAATTATKITLRNGSTTASRVKEATALIAEERAGSELLAAATEPDVLVSQQRLALLGLLSNAWVTSPTDWAADAATANTAFRATANAVSIDRGSAITYGGGRGSIPISVQNGLPYPVTVVLKATASNARLVIDKAVKVTIGANDGSRPKLPVHSISNGAVTITAFLETPAGVRIGSPAKTAISVNAGWETVGAVIVAAALVALFATGVYRNVTRRRRRLRQSGNSNAEAAAE